MFKFLYGKNYYLSSLGNDKNTGDSPSQSWFSLSKLQQFAGLGLVKPGDSILFRRGDVFTGVLSWMSIRGQKCPGGTVKYPIVFSSYGVGQKPLFQYPEDSVAQPENRILFWFAGVDNIVIDGLKFVELKKNLNGKVSPANIGIPIYFGAMDEATCNNCIVKNTEISRCGMGIVLIGNNNIVSRCNFTDFYNLRNTSPVSEKSKYDDYGANAITITGNENLIENNYINGAWSESEDFGWNGGAIEMFNNCNRNKISSNVIIDCAGLVEFGAAIKNASSADNSFEFNSVVNCGSVVWCNTTGIFAVQVSNTGFCNNLIVENYKSRFSGPNTGKGIQTSGVLSKISPENALFSFSGNPMATIIFDVQNNTFDLSTGIAVVRKNIDFKKTKFRNNLYYLSGGSVKNFPNGFQDD